LSRNLSVEVVRICVLLVRWSLESGYKLELGIIQEAELKIMNSSC